ncbi:hypothetical protein PpBr36_01398 [Pyricularia pennisetigena]|uniref:hypothetical protein n=1 Tax=Pyricularia pennisetigena TaxID=1578925 RepID=UPI001153C66A|nr:hypothetical protein PpBr36_01398 [Pyricularia pennisetigena]TLS28043.1 hypothetical protein PpBr36_01398 [Pyricularia pennisetigena]
MTDSTSSLGGATMMASNAQMSPSFPHPPAADAPARSDSLRTVGAHGAAAARTTTPAGATVYGPDVLPDGSLNPRSCIICRKRKVKCDHLQPCTNCRRARVSCVFPAPGRAPRRPRPKDPNGPTASGEPGRHGAASEREAELMKRLRKLEGIVEDLSGQIELETARHGSTGGPSPDAMQESPGSVEPRSTGRGSSSSTTGVRAASTASNASHSNLNSSHANGSPHKSSQTVDSIQDSPPSTTDVAKKFGRLVLHDKGKSRYVSSGFWSRINDEINELRAETEEMLDSETDVSDNDDSPPAVPLPDTYSNGSFLFGYRCSDLDLRKFHLPPSQIMFIWDVYCDNVNPVTKILHVPSTKAMLLKAKDDLGNIDPSFEALMFGIYFGALTSMDETDVEMHFGATQAHMLQKYRYALEMALAKADFLTSTDLMTLQALVLFVMLVRRRQDTRLAWTMTGVAVRISQSIGLHRDPSNFPNLTPFEGEMRRRLFWYLALLDLRAAEDQGTDVAIHDLGYDTRRPLNINDDDFGPDSKELPPPREGETEMAFVLMSYEVQPYARRILLLSSAAASMCPRAVNTLEEREKLLMEISGIAERILPRNGPAPKMDISILAAMIVRVILSKMTILVYQTSLIGPHDASEDLSQERKDRLVLSAIEVFEYSHLVLHDPRVRRWRWVAHVFMQWQAVTFLLLAISTGPWSPISERGWSALGTMFSGATAAAEIDRISDNAAVWLPFKRLYNRAKRHRVAEIARLRADPAAAGELDREWYPKTLPTSNFGTLSGRIKIKVALDRWRELVQAPALEPEVQASFRRDQERQNPHLHNSSCSMGASSTSLKNAAVNDLAVQPVAVGQQQQQQQQRQQDGARATAPAAQQMDPDFLQLMNQVMSQDTFASQDIWPLAFPVESVQAQNAGLAFGYANNRAGGPGFSQPPQPQPQPTASETPLLDAAMRKGDAPPWMWTETGAAAAAAVPGGDFNNLASVINLGTAGGDQFGGLSSLEDFDMNMDDEDFNWQTFNDSIRGFSTTGWGQLHRTVFTCAVCGEAVTYQTTMRVPCARVVAGHVSSCDVQTIVSNRTVQRGRCSKH